MMDSLDNAESEKSHTPVEVSRIICNAAYQTADHIFVCASILVAVRDGGGFLGTTLVVVRIIQLAAVLGEEEW